jgi:hypothetical protein
LQKRRAALKSGKTAICISGQLRTGIEAYPGFKKFFNSLGNYDVFYHTWTLDAPVSQHVQELYNPVVFVEEPAPDTAQQVKESSFGVMLYSIMKANELKKKYEIENNFRYDLVIKTRFDLAFSEDSLFPTDPLWPRTIYSVGGNVGINHTDYQHHGISDLIFWGDSQSMDLATNVYRYYKYTALVKNEYLKSGYKLDPLDYYLSPGTLIYEQTIHKNIAHVRQQGIFREVPWRSDVAHLDPLKDFEKIRNRYAQG